MVRVIDTSRYNSKVNINTITPDAWPIDRVAHETVGLHRRKHRKTKVNHPSSTSQINQLAIMKHLPPLQGG
ncbi:Uncharacterized protein APZ42_002568 [Daphnia magna]|uniref:Uncharacterized protein n=1 Tax=Daphnia magna TaxID=35525 RepID=A0A0P5RAV6_9CRUS|nr:Uncharacterized protein APZ42_002568 [Daphnia magna]